MTSSTYDGDKRGYVGNISCALAADAKVVDAKTAAKVR